MKDLLKICRRYIIMAVLTVCLVLAVNIIFFFVYVVREKCIKLIPTITTGVRSVWPIL